MTASKPLLSVTVTNYNYGRFLPINVDSILRQTFEDFELIIIDNASTDDSMSILKTYAAQDPRIRLIAHEHNQSARASFLESCDVSRGRYRVHVDADDWVMSPTAFERQVALLEQNPQMTFAYSVMATTGSDGEQYCHRFYSGDQLLTGAVAVQQVLRLSLGHSGLMLRLDAYRECGGYPEDFVFYDDVMLAARMCELGDVGYLDDALYGARHHGANENLLVDIDVIDNEVFRMIDEILDGPLGSEMDNAKRMRRRLKRDALLNQPTQYVFNGRLRLGWKLYAQSVRRHPLLTVFQLRTVSLVARTLLGATLFERGRDGAKRLLTRE